MPKVSRPVIYTILAAVAAYAVVLYTEPDAPAKKHIITKSAIAGNAALVGDVTSADYAVHFDTYKVHNIDPFNPKISNKNNGNAMPGFILGSGQKGGWTLTGISIIDGDRSALIENASTGETEFLKTGDKWNGLTVLAVEPSSVSLANSSGTKVTMSFSETSDTPIGTPSTAAANNVPQVPSLPGFNGAGQPGVPGGGQAPAINFPGGNPSNMSNPFGGTQQQPDDNSGGGGGTQYNGRRGRRDSSSSLIAVPLTQSHKSTQTVPVIPPMNVTVPSATRT